MDNSQNNIGLFLQMPVCDGVFHSEISSDFTLPDYKSEIRKLLSSKAKILPPRQYIGNKNAQVIAHEIKKALLTALSIANDAVYSYARTHIGMKGMGTTIVATLVIDKTIFALNVGDSRVYFLKGSKIKQITKDHSYVQYLIDNGQITEEEAMNSSHKNIITRAVGTEREVEGDVYKESVTEGTFILLCSDGLANFVDSATMCDIVSNDYNARTIDEIGLNVRVRKLVDTANANGGSDNITAVLVKL